jgi:photosystem II stability/assembly factor-like uncharacterized protein
MRKIFLIVSISLTILACTKEIESPQKEQANKSWVALWNDFNTDLLSVSFLNKDTGYVITYADSIFSQSLLTTHDGGKSWTSKIFNNNPRSKFYYNIVPFENVMYGNYFSESMDKRFYTVDHFVKSYDGGASWFPVIFEAQVIQYITYFLKDSLNMFINTGEIDSITGKQFPRLISTSDGGKTWQNESIIANDAIQQYKVYFLSKYTGIMMVFYFNKNTSIHKTTDGGQTWIETAGYLPSINVQCINEKIWYCNKSDTLFKTTNSGVSWEKLFKFSKTNDRPANIFFYSRQNFASRNYSNYLNRLQFVSEDTGYYYEDKDVLKTIDGGITWNIDFALNSKPNYAKIVGMAVVKTGEVYIITDCGTIFKKAI